MTIAIISHFLAPEDIGFNKQIQIFSRLNHEVIFLTGESYPESVSAHEHSIEIKHQHLIPMIKKSIKKHLVISYKLWMNKDKIDISIIEYATDLVLPVILSKFLGKRTFILIGGLGSYCEKSKGNARLAKFIALLERFNLDICDNIISYTPTCIKHFNISRFSDKILLANQNYIDLDRFNIFKDLNRRCNCIGYVGRMSEEKGVINLAKAIELDSEILKDYKFSFIGDGPLKELLKNRLSRQNLKGEVVFLDWIPNADLPLYLNELRLIIQPSFTEGLPTGILEAMACGVPVLATSVGGIPDIVHDGETGFLMEKNSPECIAKNILRVLKYKDIDKVILNARALVEREYSYERVVENWDKILSDTNGLKNVSL